MSKNGKTNGHVVPSTRGAFYVRMSSDQQESSPEIQRKDLRGLLAKHNATLVKEYADMGISGAATNKRKGFAAMLNDAQKGLFDVLFVWDLDRFSRADMLETNHFFYMLRTAGVRIITHTKGEVDLSSLGGLLMAGIDANGNSDFLKKLSVRVTSGKQNAAQKGDILGRIPYGYDRIFFDETGKEVHRCAAGSGFKKPDNWTAKLAISTSGSAEIMRQIFNRLATTDVSLRQICLDLNLQGLTGCDGGIWQSGNVGKMLGNRAYIGEYRIGPGIGKFSRMEAEVFIADAHPALVTKEVFERVQRKLASRRKTRTKPRRSWTLIGGGLGRCGHCGGLLKSHSYYNTKGQNGQVYERGRPHSYNCGRRANGFPCPSGQVNADDLHRLMIEAYKAAWLSPEGQRHLREQLLAKIKQQSAKPAATDEKRLRSQIATLEKKITKGTERLLIVDAADVPAVSKLLADWRAERDTIQALLRSPQNDSKGKPAGTPEQIVERALKTFSELERRLHVEDVEIAREAFHQAFESATIWWRTRKEPGKRVCFDVCRAVIVLRTTAALWIDCPIERAR